jgi:HlyD family secretion protein
MLTVSGTAEPIQDATADFQIAGTISGVDVTLGQHVTDGEILATLDTSTLQQQVSTAQTTLAAAEATLSENEAGESSGASSSTGNSATDVDTTTASSTDSAAAIVLTAAITPPSSTTLPGNTKPSTNMTLRQAQQAVTATQHTADLDLQTAAADLIEAETTCASTVTTPTTTSTTIPATTTSTTTAPTGSSACAAALGQALAAQNTVATDQKAVANAETVLAQILTSLSSNPSSSSSEQKPSETSPTGKGTPTASKPTGTQTSSTATDSAQQLASDQAQIDADDASLVDAQQSLSDTKLTSPISGTVASVGLSNGQSVTAGSSGDAITIINSGSYQSTSSLTSSQVAEVAVGDQAQVTVDGTTGTISGTVSRVGPVDVSGTSYTYPLVVALTSTGAGIAAGSTSQVQIDLAHAGNTLVVPTSAVHTTSTHDSYVIVLQAGKQTDKKVSLGVVGDIYTQITAGITKGTTLVLANLSQAVPSSSTNSTTRTFGGASGLPTGGFPSGGLPSGGFPSGGFSGLGSS